MSPRSSARMAGARGTTTLTCGLTPRGRIDVHEREAEDGPALTAAARRRIRAAFETCRGHGVLKLGAGELETALHPSLAHWRDFGKTFVGRICVALDPTDPKRCVVPDPVAEELEDFAHSAPPMEGAELVSVSLLEARELELVVEANDASR